MTGLLNAIAFAFLLTSLFILRFRGWKRPGLVVAYFVFFAVLEGVASRYFLPPEAFGSSLAPVCISLSLPVWIAIVLIWRHERASGISD